MNRRPDRSPVTGRCNKRVFDDSADGELRDIIPDVTQ
jgi:hypothetical protein